MKTSIPEPAAAPLQVLYEKDGLRITSTPVDHYHTAGPVAYRLDWNGLSVTYSGACAQGLEASGLGGFIDIWGH